MLVRATLALTLGACLLLLSPDVGADLPAEEVGQVARLPDTMGDHWVWVPDRLLRHSALFDGDDGRMLGQVDSGAQITPKPPMVSRSRSEVYSVDTVYSRGHRGERKDFVVVYDSRTLDVKADIEIPPRTADTAMGIALVGLLDGDRFLIVLNQSPGTSVSVVDLETRTLAAEVQAQGCAGVFPAGPKRFGLLCGNGTVMSVHLTDAGAVDRTARSGVFFDVVADPVSEKGVRDGSTWWFVSFGGKLYEVDFGPEKPTVQPPWSLLSEQDRDDDWRVGGAQHLTLHRATQRLYSIVHQGGPGSHKAPGPEVWVYDLASQTRIDRFSPPNLIAAFLGPQAGFEPAGMTAKILNFILPNMGVHSIAVTQDDAPLLFYRHADLGAMGVMDALSGEHLRDITEIGLSGTPLEVP